MENAFPDPYRVYRRRDDRIRRAVANALNVALTEVQSLSWNEVIEMAEQLGISTK